MVEQIDRLARKAEHIVAIWEMLKSWGCELHDTVEGHVKTYEQAYRLAGKAEDGRRFLLSRSRSGLLHSAGDGHLLYPLYGFKKSAAGGVPDHHPLQARVVRLIFRLYRIGFTVGTITKHLNRKKYPCPRGGKRWTTQGVSAKLKTLAYAGIVHYGQTRVVDNVKYDVEEEFQIFERGVFKPIVTLDTFLAVQDRINSRRRVRRVDIEKVRAVTEVKPVDMLKSNDMFGGDLRYTLSKSCVCQDGNRMHIASSYVGSRHTIRLSCSVANGGCNHDANNLDYRSVETAAIVALRETLSHSIFEEMFSKIDDDAVKDVSRDIEGEIKAAKSDVKAARDDLGNLVEYAARLGLPVEQISGKVEKRQKELEARELFLANLLNEPVEIDVKSQLGRLRSLRESLDIIANWTPLIGDGPEVTLLREMIRETIALCVVESVSSCVMRCTIIFDLGVSIGDVPQTHVKQVYIYTTRHKITHSRELKLARQRFAEGDFRMSDKTWRELRSRCPLPLSIKSGLPEERRRMIYEALAARMAFRLGWSELDLLFDNKDRAFSFTKFEKKDDGKRLFLETVLEIGPEAFGLRQRTDLDARSLTPFAPIVNYMSMKPLEESDESPRRFAWWDVGCASENRARQSRLLSNALRAHRKPKPVCIEVEV